MTALVFSAGGMYAAWEAGVWKSLADRVRPGAVVGTSAGAWSGWAIAGGASPDDLIGEWLDGSLAAIRVLRAGPLHQKARELAERFHPQIPFGLTVVEAARLRVHLVRDSAVTWRHLAATCSIPGLFPAVPIDGRRYVDGGLMGALPLWAAEEMGATHAVGINCLHGLPFRVLRAVTRPRGPSSALQVSTIQPSERLGSLHDAVRWSRPLVERWIELGMRDGLRWLESGAAAANR